MFREGCKGAEKNGKLGGKNPHAELVNLCRGKISITFNAKRVNTPEGKRIIAQGSQQKKILNDFYRQMETPENIQKFATMIIK